MKIKKAFGLDLGTTNSTISIFKDGESLFGEDYKLKGIPSIVSVKNDELIVGVKAKNYLNEKSIGIKSVKRLMGKEEIINCNGIDFTPEEVSSEIIKYCASKLKEKYEDGEVEYSRAVVTVPAYFTKAQTDATRKAVELAGFEVLLLLEEPTAAAINYTYKQNIDNGIFMVYDFGGGTFDVSIIEKIENIPIVLATSGNNYLGGDNLDNILANYFLSFLKDELGYDLDIDNDSNQFQHLKLAAENVKKQLSNEEQLNIFYPDIFKDNSSVELIIENFNRKQFEDLIIDKIKIDTIKECSKALEKLKKNHDKTLDDIDGIILVGGSCKIPLVQKTVKEKFCTTKKLKDIIIFDTDLAVGSGAGIVASTFSNILTDEDKGLEIEINPVIDYEGTKLFSGEIIKGDITNVNLIINNEIFVLEVKDRNFECEVADIDLTDYNIKFFKESELVAELNEALDENASIIAPTSVQNETIKIEIIDLETGKIENYPVVKEGESLPCERTYDFKINEYSEDEIILPVKEGSRHIFDVKCTLGERKKIGTKISVTISIDEKANILIKVYLNGVELKSEYVYAENKKINSKQYESLVEDIEEKINIIEDKEHKDDIRLEKENLVREIKEAESNQDESHFTYSFERLESLKNKIKKDTKYSEEKFNELYNEIKTEYETVEDENALSFSLEDVEDCKLFGIRALERKDELQFEKNYEEMEYYRFSITLNKDSKTFSLVLAGNLFELVESANKIMDSTSDVSLKNKLELELKYAQNILVDFTTEFEKNESVLDYSKYKVSLLSAWQKLSRIVSEISPGQVNLEEKNNKFKGRVSKIWLECRILKSSKNK